MKVTSHKTQNFIQKIRRNTSSLSTRTLHAALSITRRERSSSSVSSISTIIDRPLIQIHPVEQKYRKRPAKEKNEWALGKIHSHTEYTSSESSTDSEEEDDEGILASENLDAQIQATLQAIRTKDPRVYDERTIFYLEDDNNYTENQDVSHSSRTKAKPMYLNDFHRRNLLKGGADPSVEDEKPLTYIQQQDDLRESIVREIHASMGDSNLSSVESEHERRSHKDEDGGSSDGDNFLIKKQAKSHKDITNINDLTTDNSLNIEAAEKDPETFLSNYLSARAWVPSAGSQFQPFESDDEDDDQRAEAFEEAFNLRFEDPERSNEKLLSHSRNVIAKYSVRKEKSNNRKKRREVERAQKEEKLRERQKDKARLRNLKISEAAEKIKKIRDAAGFSGSQLEDQDWITFLDEGWDDNSWEEQMRRKFGDRYYADHGIQEGENGTAKDKSKFKKPKWRDEIDIEDLVEDKDDFVQHEFPLTGNELGSSAFEFSLSADVIQEPTHEPQRNGRQIRKEIEYSKSEARRQRRKIELHVDNSLNRDEILSGFGTKHAGHFRYRETSPLAYGLTAHDILMATDAQLNQYTGLKKLATYRDAEKKKKDKRRLGKKARLRQWRKETFGDEDGPQITLKELFSTNSHFTSPSANSDQLVPDNSIGKKKRARSGRRKPAVGSWTNEA